MSEKSDLFFRHRETAEKFTYFVLTAAAASIAFAISQTQSASLAYSQIPLVFALASWAVSFYAGCRHISMMQSVTNQNYEYLRIKDGQHPEFPNHPDVLQVIQEAMSAAADKSGVWGQRQFAWLLTGAVFFVVWHFVGIALRTAPLQNVTLLQWLR